MKTLIEIILFVLVTLGPLTLLWLRVETEKRRRSDNPKRPDSERSA